MIITIYATKQIQYVDWSKCFFILQSLKQELSTYEAQREVTDERLKCLEAEQEQVEQELITFQGNYYHLGV